MKEEEVPVEAKTGISSPVMLGGAKFLKAVGLRKMRKNFDEGLGASIKKFTEGKNQELTKTIMVEASDIKLTLVKDEIVSTVESEQLCRAYIYLYLGEEPLAKEGKIWDIPAFSFLRS
ncbi:hypothetical protein Sango_0067900 [Sesamum angolense]|uniref:Uncharacterized protein n=1 Tax=Sesamum angolense TaxID=2727404 RepID=A0AAE1XEI2_9LAMI|nr:hypothetical protein Sango_0067900 [Sesamum angolense]